MIAESENKETTQKRFSGSDKTKVKKLAIPKNKAIETEPTVSPGQIKTDDQAMRGTARKLSSRLSSNWRARLQ